MNKKQIIEALQDDSTIVFEGGRPKLVTPLPYSEDGPRATVTCIRRDVFERLQPLLDGEVDNPYEDYSAITYRLRKED